jgi:hypothetical protein
VRTLFEFSINKTNSTNTGFFTFDGHYYTDDADFPAKMAMYHLVQDESAFDPATHQPPWIERRYEIEIYRRDIIENTDIFIPGAVDDMDVCFFPTNKQTLHFRILEARPV